MRIVVLALLAVGCGRFHFDEVGITGDGSPTRDVITGDSVIDPDLVLWYPFEDVAAPIADASGHGHVGTCTSCPVRTVGQVGNGFLFDGIANFLETPDVADLRLTTGTIVFWARVETAPSGRGHYVSKPFGSLGADSWELASDAFGAILIGGDASAFQYVYSSNLAIGSWWQVAMTWDAGMATAYVDAIPVDVPFAFTPVYDANPLVISGDIEQTGVTSFLAMTMDELRIYRRVLSPSELAMLRQ